MRGSLSEISGALSSADGVSSKSGVLFKFSPGSCRSSRILDLSDNAATPVISKVNTCACVIGRYFGQFF